MWAPDSLAAFVVYSDAGAIGQYHTILVSSRLGKITSLEPTASAANDFLKYFDQQGLTCLGEGHLGVGPNIVPIRWVGNTRAILATQIIPHSVCDCFGSFRAYEVEIPSGKIVRAIGQTDAKREFAADLGPSLANATNDEWDRRPSACKLPPQP
jgi:hypothetical protein